METEKLLVMSNFSFSHIVFKSCLLLLCQNEYLWSKRFKAFSPFPTMFSKSLFPFIVKILDCSVTVKPLFDRVLHIVLYCLCLAYSVNQDMQALVLCVA